MAAAATFFRGRLLLGVFYAAEAARSSADAARAAAQRRRVAGDRPAFSGRLYLWEYNGAGEPAANRHQAPMAVGLHYMVQALPAVSSS